MPWDVGLGDHLRKGEHIPEVDGWQPDVIAAAIVVRVWFSARLLAAIPPVEGARVGQVVCCGCLPAQRLGYRSYAQGLG